jgi:hypothetical protein
VKLIDLVVRPKPLTNTKKIEGRVGQGKAIPLNRRARFASRDVKIAWVDSAGIVLLRGIGKTIIDVIGLERAERVEVPVTVEPATAAAAHDVIELPPGDSRTIEQRLHALEHHTHDEFGIVELQEISG